MTSEEREWLQAMLGKQDVEQAEKERKLLKHEMNLRTVKNAESGSRGVVPFLGITGAAERRGVPSELSGSRGQGMGRRKQKRRAGKGLGLRQMKLTERERRELRARIRGAW